MDLTGPLAAATAYARRLQNASCVITRADTSAGPTLDSETGELTGTDPAEVYDGPCLVLPVGASQVAEFGDRPTSLRQYNVTLKGLSEDVHVEDLVTVASDADPILDGLELRVLDVKKSALPTNRRLVAEEVIS